MNQNKVTQKVVNLSPDDGAYHNFFAYTYPDTLAGHIQDGWTVKHIFETGKEHCTILFEKTLLEGENK